MTVKSVSDLLASNLPLLYSYSEGVRSAPQEDVAP